MAGLSVPQLHFLGTGSVGVQQSSDTHGVTALMDDLPCPPTGIKEAEHDYALCSDSWMAHYHWAVEPNARKGGNKYFSVPAPVAIALCSAAA